MFSAPSIENLTPTRPTSGPIAPVVGDWAIMETRFESPHTQVARCIPVHSELADRTEYLIKMPRWDAQSSEAARRIIRREAELLNGFDHPHLISVLDAELRNSLPFFIMPNVGNWTVRDWIGEAGSVSIHDALWLTRQTASALQYLHQSGWSHLDLKPENIVVNELGHVTVVDLAFATPFRVRNKDPLPLAGTANYIAPERRVRGWQVSPAADIFSLGQILTELLLGELGQPHSNKLKRCERANVIRSFYPNLPPDLITLIDQMTAGVPERRPSIDDIANSLIRWEIALWQP